MSIWYSLLSHLIDIPLFSPISAINLLTLYQWVSPNAFSAISLILYGYSTNILYGLFTTPKFNIVPLLAKSSLSDLFIIVYKPKRLKIFS